MESLELPTLCRIASHLQYWDFYSFVTTCRAFSACRDDPQTLSVVIVNTTGRQPCLLSFKFGSHLIRFYAEHLAENLVEAVVSALDQAGYKGETRAIIALRPLCSERVVSCVLDKCASEFIWATAAMMHLDVNQKQRDALISKMPESLRDVFPAYYDLAANGVLPEDLLMFHMIAHSVMPSPAYAQDLFIQALMEMDASGAFLAKNVERTIGLLCGLAQTWEPIARDTNGDPVLCTSPRQKIPAWIPRHLVIFQKQTCRHCHSVDFVLRLAELFPSPISWDIKMVLYMLFLKMGSIDAIKKLYSPSRVEAEWIFAAAFNPTVTNGDAFKVWILSTWDFGELSAEMVNGVTLQICRADARQQEACLSRLVAGASPSVKEDAKTLETVLANLVARKHLDPERLVNAVYEAAFAPVLKFAETTRLFATMRKFNLRLGENISKRFMQTCKNRKYLPSEALDVFVAFERAFKDQSISPDAIAIGLIALVTRHHTAKMDERASIRTNVDFVFKHWNDASMAVLERCIKLSSSKGDMSMTLHLADNNKTFAD